MKKLNIENFIGKTFGDLQEAASEIGGKIYVKCVLDDLPHHNGKRRRYQLYNDEDFDVVFDIETEDDTFNYNSVISYIK